MRASFLNTGNVLVDLGFDDAEELTAKASLAVKLNQIIEKRGLSQAEAAAITGMTQPKVSQVRRYKLQNISYERLEAGNAMLEDLGAFFAESDRHLTPAARKLTEADVARLVRESR